MIKKIWEKIKSFFVNNYKSLINWSVLVLVYIINKNPWIDALVGLWIFAQLALYMWEWFQKKSAK